MSAPSVSSPAQPKPDPELASAAEPTAPAALPAAPAAQSGTPSAQPGTASPRSATPAQEGTHGAAPSEPVIDLARPRRPKAALLAIIDEASSHFDDDSDPIEIMRWFGEQLGVDRIAVAVSFSDGVMACLGAKALPGVDLLFADTGYHFAETIGLRDAVTAMYPVNVRSLVPELTVAEQDHRHGERLWERDPDRCCAMRKTAPMDAALHRYDAWATGLRRADHAGRVETPLVSWDAKHEMIKINPIVAYTDQMIDACIEEHRILHNPLRSIGYRSIGCSPCTRPVLDGEDERAGRWSGRTKVECGLHL